MAWWPLTVHVSAHLGSCCLLPCIGRWPLTSSGSNEAQGRFWSVLKDHVLCHWPCVSPRAHAASGRWFWEIFRFEGMPFKWTVEPWTPAFVLLPLLLGWLLPVTHLPAVLWFDYNWPSQVHLLEHLVPQMVVLLWSLDSGRSRVLRGGSWSGPASGWALASCSAELWRAPVMHLDAVDSVMPFLSWQLPPSDTTSHNSSFSHFSCFLSNIWL